MVLLRAKHHVCAVPDSRAAALVRHQAQPTSWAPEELGYRLQLVFTADQWHIEHLHG